MKIISTSAFRFFFKTYLGAKQHTVYKLGGVKLAFKDPSFAQGSVIFAYLNCHLPEQSFQTLTYMLDKLPLQIQTIEGALQYKIAPLTPPNVHSIPSQLAWAGIKCTMYVALPSQEEIECMYIPKLKYSYELTVIIYVLCFNVCFGHLKEDLLAAIVTCAQ